MTGGKFGCGHYVSMVLGWDGTKMDQYLGAAVQHVVLGGDLVRIMYSSDQYRAPDINSFRG
jgi:hypothetical protein